MKVIHRSAAMPVNCVHNVDNARNVNQPRYGLGRVKA